MAAVRITLIRTLRAALLTGALYTGACAPIKLIADYDATSVEETIRVGKRVDLFYGKILELDPPARVYAPFAEQYIDIEADIRSLVRRNTMRPLNSESTRISNIILDFWVQYHKKHKEKNAYPDASLDRTRFDRLFTAALSAEAAKKVTGDSTSSPASPPDR